MPTPQADTRSESRKTLDEQLAAAPLLPFPDIGPESKPSPLQAHLRPRRGPMAVRGVVENGVIRLLDSKVTFPEQTHVLVVASDLS